MKTTVAVVGFILVQPPFKIHCTLSQKGKPSSVAMDDDSLSHYLTWRVKAPHLVQFANLKVFPNSNCDWQVFKTASEGQSILFTMYKLELTLLFQLRRLKQKYCFFLK